MGYSHRYIIVLGILFSHLSFGQNSESPDTSKYSSRITDANPRFYRSHDTVWIYSGICKTLKTTMLTGVKQPFFPYEATVVSSPADLISSGHVTPKTKFITIHGNISYDYFSRSRIDTPINQQNFHQHTERVYLDILVKEKYPLKVNFTSRQSNSPYFRDFADVNFNFDKYTYDKNLRQQLLDKLNKQVPQYKLPDLTAAEALLKKYQSDFDITKAWLEDPATLQKIIEERERLYYQKLKSEQDSIQSLTGKDSIRDSANKINTDLTALTGKAKAVQKKFADSLNSLKENILTKKAGITDTAKAKADSAAAPFAAYYKKQKAKLDSLQKIVAKYKTKTDSIKTDVQKDVAGIRQKIYKATSENELRKLAEENGIPIDKKTKLEKQLAAIKTFSIGRSVLNYTELTAQNITVSGVNIEYNPSCYAAFAAGKIDYRFRDFYNRKTRQNNQYIIMGRLGLGDKDHTAIIFSYFTGRKSNNNYGYRDSANSPVNLMGYSVEAILKKDENNFLSAEFAKSTKPVIGNFSASKQSGSLLRFHDPSNMGINFKARTIIPETHTKLSGFYRKTGENFQSFSLFSYNTNQTAWLGRIDQSFYKDRITLSGMLRRNDFTNPFTDKTYKTSTIFKSVLLNVRLRKFPVISIGYYPGTQLYLIDKETIRESAYYILNGSASYSYIIKGLQLHSMAVYNKYTSEATDSGFVAYRGINVYASQAIRFSKIQLQAGYAYTRQSLLQYSTFEATGDYSFRSWLKVGAGLKCNNVKGGTAYWGQSIQLRTEFKKWGGLLLQYEKSYLPTFTQQLAPVEIGRVSYYRRF
jgi:hypothetical protein